MPDVVIELHLTPGQVLAYYRGSATAVRVTAVSGEVIQFPASALRRLVTTEGVHGRFRLRFDDQRKFVSLEAAP